MIGFVLMSGIYAYAYIVSMKAFCDGLSATHQGVHLLPVRADCSQEQEVEAMFRTVIKELGHVDILVGGYRGSEAAITCCRYA
jgi:NAD(P)-dependent dehydrogenase (short-subunit alcohol dehydrogenase family)